MAKRKVAGAQVNEVKSAWKKAQRAWLRVEDSLASLVESDKALIRKLQKAGKAVATEARGEARSVIRQLDRRRKSALKRFEKITGQHRTLRRPAA